jgi:hypothetical protein
MTQANSSNNTVRTSSSTASGKITFLASGQGTHNQLTVEEWPLHPNEKMTIVRTDRNTFSASVGDVPFEEVPVKGFELSDRGAFQAVIPGTIEADSKGNIETSAL